MMNFGLFMQQQQRQLAEVAQRVQQQQREAEDKRKQDAENARRAIEQTRIQHERMLNDMKRFEQLLPKTIVYKPGPNAAAPPPPIVFR